MSAFILPKRTFTLLAISSLLLVPVAPQQSKSSSTSQAEAQSTYPNTSEGLRQLLQDIRLAAQRRDDAKLSALIKGTEIPNYETWFTETFGQEKGESWAGPYEKNLDRMEKKFQEFMMQAAQEDGEILVQKVDATKMYDTLKAPLDLFLASWKKSTSPEGQEPDYIGYFTFIDGKFRWDSTEDFFKAQKSNLVVAEPKLIKRVAPEYPAEAREKRIQGTVKLNVIIRKDGSITVQNVVRGDRTLVPAAIEAVRQWRYRPTTVNGQPVEVQTTIDVNFALD